MERMSILKVWRSPRASYTADLNNGKLLGHNRFATTLKQLLVPFVCLFVCMLVGSFIANCSIVSLLSDVTTTSDT